MTEYKKGTYGGASVIWVSIWRSNHVPARRNQLLDTIIAEDGTYPTNGIQGDYWYVRGARVFPDFKLKVDGQLKASDNGWVKVNGQLKAIDRIWVKANGQLKEV